MLAHDIYLIGLLVLQYKWVSPTKETPNNIPNSKYVTLETPTICSLVAWIFATSYSKHVGESLELPLCKSFP